jgi:GNAT superfamily N-acetyltransferase
MSKITYTNEVLDSYSGQINCEAGIYENNEIMGYVQYVLYDGELTVSDIMVRPDRRREGFGSMLMKYIKEKNPEYTYQPSMKTDLGAKFVHKDVKLNEALNKMKRLFNAG